MIRRISPESRLALRRRDAFTLLEVLVVVAIIVILATVSSIYVFRYLDDAKQDTARQNMAALEKACKAYILKSGGNAPPSLTELIQPSDGGRPFIDGGQSALMDPWNQPYQYNGANVNASGDPDPIVSTKNPGNGQVIYALGRH
jgi:general secretion pathway protein G